MALVFNKIGVIGDGKMGIDLVHLFIDQDYPVVWICHPKTETHILFQQIEKKLKRKVKFGQLTEPEYLKKITQITITSDLNYITNCSLIIEAIWENRESKNQLWKQIIPIAAPTSILTSNSSSILPQSILEGNVENERFAGLHFFYPTAYFPHLEIIKTSFTQTQVIETLQLFGNELKKHVWVQDHNSAFLLNRLALEFQLSAVNASLEMNLNYLETDRLFQNYFPSGIYRFFDSVGLDVMLSSVTTYIRQFEKDAARFQNLINLLDSLVKKGHLGQKNGQGFYTYPQNTEQIPQQELRSEQKKLISNSIGAYISYAEKIAKNSNFAMEKINDASKDYFGTEVGLLDLFKKLNNG